MDFSNIEVDVLEFDSRDYPEFSDAFIVTAFWKDSGKELTDEELDEVNNNGEFVYDCVIKRIFG